MKRLSYHQDSIQQLPINNVLTPLRTFQKSLDRTRSAQLKERMLRDSDSYNPVHSDNDKINPNSHLNKDKLTQSKHSGSPPAMTCCNLTVQLAHSEQAQRQSPQP
ncbi:hypothetical protein PoB_003904300 [Plakobranchus ocellatus]|uniref:Uncharacterized protein n=1 Tax=Plakobranchus ocellatus TaxID=259542 RepID=A0AAV4B1D0_9GAST|nr:hypothetical protein PoB_003904300 [Plakobranchus ocellatus]